MNKTKPKGHTLFRFVRDLLSETCFRQGLLSLCLKLFYLLMDNLHSLRWFILPLGDLLII